MWLFMKMSPQILKTIFSHRRISGYIKNCGFIWPFWQYIHCAMQVVAARARDMPEYLLRPQQNKRWEQLDQRVCVLQRRGTIQAYYVCGLPSCNNYSAIYNANLQCLSIRRACNFKPLRTASTSRYQVKQLGGLRADDQKHGANMLG